jgi:hypothetical protein
LISANRLRSSFAPLVDGGGNEIASEAGAALGQVRIQEAKQALAIWASTMYGFWGTTILQAKTRFHLSTIGGTGMRSTK